MAARQDILFDKRTVSRNIHRCKTTQKEYEGYLKKLPDVAGKAVTLLEGMERDGGDALSRKHRRS